MISFTRQCYLTWVDYLGLKLHFNNKHDWQIGNRPLPNWTTEAFMARKDVQSFAAFVDFVPHPRERIERLISTFIKNSQAHVSTAHHLPDDIAEFHVARMRVIGSLSYVLEQDLDIIYQYCYNSGISLVDLLSLGDKHTPSIVSDVNKLGINLETLSVLDTLFGFTRFESISPLWNKNRVMICQYGKLIKYDKQKVKLAVDKILTCPRGNS